MARSLTHTDAEILAALEQGGAERERMSDYLFEAWQGYLRKCRQKYSLSETQARDAYTDALMSLLRQIEAGRFRGESQLGTYFFRILSTKCIDQIRRPASNLSDWQSLMPEWDAPIQDFLGEMITKDEVSHVQQMLASLGERCRQLIMLADYWGYKPKEIAEKMGLASPSSASSQKHKCMQRLREQLRKSLSTR